LADEGIKRKLTAILNADAAGYSRMMAEDEVGTVQRLKSHRELIGESVKEHHGHGKLPTREIDKIYSCKIKKSVNIRSIINEISKIIFIFFIVILNLNFCY